MKIEVKRIYLGETFTIGKVFIDDKDVNIFTLEDKVREISDQPVKDWKVQNTTAIPSGTYKMIIDFSTRFQKLMPHILDVEGFTGVRIHSGNTSSQTEGCLILGSTWDGHSDFVGSSKVAVAKFLELIKGQDVSIKISLPPA